MSNVWIKSKSRVNWFYDQFYMMIRNSYIDCKIELIENYPCNNAEQLNTYIYIYIYDKLTKKLI